MNIGRIAAIAAGGAVAVVGARKLQRSRSANSARAQQAASARPSSPIDRPMPGERRSADSLDETEEIFPIFDPVPENVRG